MLSKVTEIHSTESHDNYVHLLRRSSLCHSLGTFGSNCTKGLYKTFWNHNTTCYCEKKILVEYFKKKVGQYDSTQVINGRNSTF